jgi:molybdate transport system substrate-binding protein
MSTVISTAPLFLYTCRQRQFEEQPGSLLRQELFVYPVPLRVRRVRTLLLALFLLFAGGCDNPQAPLTLYAGKGLKHAVDEIEQSFEEQTGIPVSVTYAGSNTLLTTLRTTRKGDVFLPGSSSYLAKAGELALASAYVAHHVPTFAVASDNPKNLASYQDLLASGVKIAVGNKDMAAIGKVSEQILEGIDPRLSFRHNIVITGSTVNELLNLVISGEVDAALVWTDMLLWPNSATLRQVDIPVAINKPKEIRVAALTTSQSPQQAAQLASFIADQGRAIFARHGFGKTD